MKIKFCFLNLLTLVVLFIGISPTNAGTIDGRFYPTAAYNFEPAKPIESLVRHYNNKIDVVFSDIDGTIIPFNKTGPRGVVPESAKQAAEQLRKANIPLILVTGRSSWEAKEIAKRMGNENTYIIGQQGAEIRNPQGQLIYQITINNKEAKKMIKEVYSFNKTHKQNSKIYVYTDGKLYMTENFKLPYLIEEIYVIKAFKDLGQRLKPVKIGIYNNNPENLKAIQAYLKKKFPNYHIDISSDCYCDISTNNSTKGNAVKKLAEILKVDLKNTATFGDAENDISMLKLIKNNGGAAIAVGNAFPRVKEAANYVTLPVNEGGFAKGVDVILMNNSLLH